MKMEIDIRDVISLIRAHYENDEDWFKEVSRRISDQLEKDGQTQLSSYIHVLTGDMKDVFVPM